MKNWVLLHLLEERKRVGSGRGVSRIHLFYAQNQAFV